MFMIEKNTVNRMAGDYCERRYGEERSENKEMEVDWTHIEERERHLRGRLEGGGPWLTRRGR